MIFARIRLRALQCDGALAPNERGAHNITLPTSREYERLHQ